jgi:hypothetical protein
MIAQVPQEALEHLAFQTTNLTILQRLAEYNGGEKSTLACKELERG